MTTIEKIAELLVKQNERVARWALERHPEIATEYANEILTLLKDGWVKLAEDQSLPYPQRAILWDIYRYAQQDMLSTGWRKVEVRE